MVNKTTNNFKQIVLEETPLIDVRAPIEYNKGTFYNSVNLPIMTDEERHIVGITYKESGNEIATNLGYQLVSGNKRQQRINAWLNQLNKEPNSLIYCFRGGSRSKITQEWIYNEAGKHVPRLEGGYKAFRTYLIESLNPENITSKPILLGGNTGSHKTQLIQRLNNSIDLEGLANHRGSSFGRFISEQPTQINFENNLAYKLIQQKEKQYLILEDEGVNIGKCFIPRPLFEYFNQGKLVILEIPFKERVNNILKEYVIESQQDFINNFQEEQGLTMWYDYIKNSFERIKKRLGNERYNLMINEFTNAYNNQISTNNLSSHENWIELLLKEYYDPMYNYQVQNREHKVIYKGNTAEVYEFLKNNYNN